MTSVMCAAAALLVVPAVAGDNPPGVRPLAVQGVTFDHTTAGHRPTPVEITTADELLKSPLFAGDRAEVRKQVSFDKEKLVVFVWGGSGQDKLTGGLVGRGGIARFRYEAGLTDDLRHHGLVFAVPKDVTVEMAT